MRQHGVQPRHRLGQNFLIDGNILDRIADIAAEHDRLPIFEIGAGLGALTLRLTQRAPAVTAVELDQRLKPILEEVLVGLSNVTILYDDALRLPLDDALSAAFGIGNGVVAGNIPYGITTPLLECLFERMERIVRIVFLVQAEVAERLCAEPGARAYGALTLFARSHCTVQTMLQVPPHLFYPPPEVHSSLILLQPDPGTAARITNRALFRKLVRAAFGQRRKMLTNALVGGGVCSSPAQANASLESAGIRSDRRGETLTLDEFITLASVIDDTA